MTTTDTSAMRPLLFADDLQFWYETLRWLGLAAYGGADFGEVVTTVSWAGDPVDADPTGMQTVLDNSLTAWLARLKQKAESSARDS